MENNGNLSSESQTDLNFSSFEKKCFEDLDKDSVTSEETLRSEKDRLCGRAYSCFQNAAASVSNMYKVSQSNSSVWPLFQVAANDTTMLYKESLDLMQNSFELGSRYGDYRRKKEILAWLKKRKFLKSIPREEVIGYVCGKPLPHCWHRTPASYGRYCGNRQEPSATRIACDDIDLNFQLFREANFQGRRSSQSGNLSISPARGMDDFHASMAREKKRVYPDCRTGSPSHKRAKMETDDY